MPADHPTLIAQLSAEDRAARWEAVHALSTQPDAIPPLIETLGHADAKTREGAATALSRSGSAAVAPLIAVLNSPQPHVRSFAVWALGELGDKRAVEPLIAHRQDAQPRVRSRIVWALARICALLDTLDDAALRQQALTVMCAALQDQRVLVRQTAAEALARMGDAAAIPALTAAYADASPKVRENVVLALGRTGDPAALPPLIQAAADPNAWVRINAARALADLPLDPAGQQQAVTALTPLLHDTREAIAGQRVCDVAADVLRTIGTPDARHAVAAWERGSTPLVSRLSGWLRGWLRRG